MDKKLAHDVHPIGIDEHNMLQNIINTLMEDNGGVSGHTLYVPKLPQNSLR